MPLMSVDVDTGKFERPLHRRPNRQQDIMIIGTIHAFRTVDLECILSILLHMKSLVSIFSIESN